MQLMTTGGVCLIAGNFNTHNDDPFCNKGRELLDVFDSWFWTACPGANSFGSALPGSGYQPEVPIRFCLQWTSLTLLGNGLCCLWSPHCLYCTLKKPSLPEETISFGETKAVTNGVHFTPQSIVIRTPSLSWTLMLFLPSVILNSGHLWMQ